MGNGNYSIAAHEAMLGAVRVFLLNRYSGKLNVTNS